MGLGNSKEKTVKRGSTEVYFTQNKDSGNKMVSISACWCYVLKRSFVAQARRILALASLHTI